MNIKSEFIKILGSAMASTNNKGIDPNESVNKKFEYQKRKKRKKEIREYSLRQKRLNKIWRR
jgi:hypothetical protein